MTARIYTLIDPRDGAVRYVGKTSKALNARLSSHISESSRGVAHHRANWIRELISIGLRPQIAQVDECDDGWELLECHWIAKLRAEGASLTNHGKGGAGSPKHGPDARARMSATARNRSEETRALLSAAAKRRPPPSAHARAKMSDAAKSISPHVRSTIAEANRGRKMPPDAVEKIRQANLGSKRSAEARAKMSAAQRRRVRTEQERENHRAAWANKPQQEKDALRAVWSAQRTGRTCSLETRQKIGAAHKGRVPTAEARENHLAAQRRRREREAAAKEAK